MKNIIDELDIAFRLISTIPVTGDNVEVMAAAKSKLRRVWEELAKLKGGDTGGG